MHLLPFNRISSSPLSLACSPKEEKYILCGCFYQKNPLKKLMSHIDFSAIEVTSKASKIMDFLFNILEWALIWKLCGLFPCSSQPLWYSLPKGHFFGVSLISVVAEIPPWIPYMQTKGEKSGKKQRAKCYLHKYIAFQCGHDIGSFFKRAKGIFAVNGQHSHTKHYTISHDKWSYLMDLLGNFSIIL